MSAGPPACGLAAVLAYSYWEARGCPHGYRLDDWLRAERHLRDRLDSQLYW